MTQDYSLKTVFFTDLKSNCIFQDLESFLLLLNIAYRQRRQWHPTPLLLPGKSHGWRSLVGCSPSCFSMYHLHQEAIFLLRLHSTVYFLWPTIIFCFVLQWLMYISYLYYKVGNIAKTGPVCNAVIHLAFENRVWHIIAVQQVLVECCLRSFL